MRGRRSRHHPNRDAARNDQKQNLVDEKRRNQRAEPQHEEEAALHGGAAEPDESLHDERESTGLMPSKKCGNAGRDPNRT